MGKRRGARYLDGAIMAVPAAIGTAEAVILHSGSRSDLEAYESTLGLLGTVTYLGADPGLASLYDAWRRVRALTARRTARSVATR
ncbi:hypothetical protein MXD61_06175 [Frankia sp. AgPm24]|nr:hypothetical protein [Frankia sp. AgPm24]MCK9921480.1 hypothetical protein [Frankia sp. AgPm24]